jgi:hypothetical protein
MFNPLTPWVAELHQDELLEEAEKNSVLGTTGTASPRLRARLVRRAGDFMVSTGTRLQERYEPTMGPAPKAYRSDC